MRVLLLSLGGALISGGMGYVLSVEQGVAATMERLVADYWRSSYDILVRPPATRSELEQQLDLVEPNSLLTLRGGITREQWQAIRSIAEVEVAAPIASVGAGSFLVPLQWTVLEPGTYRVLDEISVYEGLQRFVSSTRSYLHVFRSWQEAQDWQPRDGVAIGVATEPFATYWSYTALLAAVDPEEEARLVGLDRAVVEGRYFQPGDLPLQPQPDRWLIPVLGNVTPYVDLRSSVRVERLPVPDRQALEAGLDRYGLGYLDEQPGVAVFSGSVDAAQFNEALRAALRTGKRTLLLTEPPAAVRFQPVNDPELEARYPTVVEAVPLGAVTWPTDPMQAYILWRPYRPWESEGEPIQVGINPIGLFDTAGLWMTLDPLTELPMETYRPPTAHLVLDGDERPVDPPRLLRAGLNMFTSFLTPPPLLLTTIDSAENLLGQAPIGAIRVRVRGVGTAGDASWRQLERVAEEIRARTGLEAEITAGSSPRRVLTRIPGYSGSAEVVGTDRTVHVDIPPLGYLELPWVQKGFGIGVLNEIRLARTAVVWTLLAVGTVFALVTSIISAEGWRRDIGLLGALGVRPVTSVALLLLEVLLIAGAGALAGLGVVAGGMRSALFADDAVAVVLLPVAILTLGALPVAARMAWSPPAPSLRSRGADHVVSRQPLGATVLGLAAASLLRRPGRNLLCALALGLPAGLLALLGFVTVELGGRLAVTRLGVHIAVQVAPEHFGVLFVALALASVLAGDQIWVSLQERLAEFGLLTALGVTPRTLRLILAAEGALLGAAGGSMGGIGAMVVFWSLYRGLPAGMALAGLAALGIPMVCAALVSQVPAMAALRRPPAQVLRAE